MNTQTYLIPANTKRGGLIFNLFRKIDLIILGVGMSISLLLIFSFPAESLVMTLLVLSPGLISGFLVLPVPNYHNILTVITSGISFLTERRMYIWRGWCFYEIDESKKN